MILRVIILIGVILYFFWDYSKDPKKFKQLVFPIVGISFFAGTPAYLKLDDRIKLIIIIVVALLTLRYALFYYNDYKIERFREKKRIRQLRDQERTIRDEKLLKEILNAKNQGLRDKSSSYEITMDFSQRTLEHGGQINFIGLEEDPFEEYYYNEESQHVEEIYEEVLENQIGMFEDSK